jgi:hypothetical protein
MKRCTLYHSCSLVRCSSIGFIHEIVVTSVLWPCRSSLEFEPSWPVSAAGVWTGDGQTRRAAHRTTPHRANPTTQPSPATRSRVAQVRPACGAGRRASCCDRSPSPARCTLLAAGRRERSAAEQTNRGRHNRQPRARGRRRSGVGTPRVLLRVWSRALRVSSCAIAGAACGPTAASRSSSAPQRTRPAYSQWRAETGGDTRDGTQWGWRTHAHCLGRSCAGSPLRRTIALPAFSRSRVHWPHPQRARAQYCDHRTHLSSCSRLVVPPRWTCSSTLVRVRAGCRSWPV